MTTTIGKLFRDIGVDEARRRDVRAMLITAASSRERRVALRYPVAAALLAGSVATGAGAAIALTTPHSARVSEIRYARCFDVVPQHVHGGGADVPGVDLGMPEQNELEPAHAVQACAALWQSGMVPSTGQARGSGAQQLTPCVLPNGAEGIFPGPSTLCADLGLANAVTE